MSDTTSSTAAPAAGTTEDKTVAILSYCTLIGFIVALIIHSSKKTALGSFHLRQALGLVVTGLGLGIALMIVGIVLMFIPVVGPLLSMLLSVVLWVGMIALLIIGIINAVNGQEKPLPVVGEYYTKWFAKAFV
jgi:uncharacterized membrane protein